MHPRAPGCTLLCPPSLRSSLVEIAPAFERESGHRLLIDWQLMPPMKLMIDAGAVFDVAILTPPLIDDAIARGTIEATTRTGIGRTGIGVAVVAGAPPPDISTAAAVARTLLAARSIAYTADGAAGQHVLAMLDRLGIRDALADRLRPMPGGGAVTPVANGAVELAITTIPGILEVPGVTLAGPLPPELQHWVTYVGGVSTTAGRTAADGAAGMSLLRFLRTGAAAAVFRAKGVEPCEQSRL